MNAAKERRWEEFFRQESLLLAFGPPPFLCLRTVQGNVGVGLVEVVVELFHELGRVEFQISSVAVSIIFKPVRS